MKNRGCVADAFLERFGAALGCQMLDFGTQNLQNITKTATKIDPKSVQNRGCVFGAFLEGVWATQGGYHPGAIFGPFSMKNRRRPPDDFNTATFESPGAAQRRQKNEKWCPKRYPKIEVENG